MVRRIKVRDILKGVIRGVVAAMVAFGSVPRDGVTSSMPSPEAFEASALSYVLHPGVIVEPGRSVVYVMNAQGIAAHDLSTGMQHWATDEAGRPLGLYGRSLVALAGPGSKGKLRLVFFNAHDGVPQGVVDAELPKGVRADVVDNPLDHFDATLTVAGGQLYLSWSYVLYPPHGAPAAGGSASPKLERSAGALRIDPADFRAWAVDLETVPDKPAWRFDLTTDERVENVPGRQFRSRSSMWRMASEMIGDARTTNRYRWTVMDQHARVVGVVHRPFSAAPFTVFRSSLVHIAPPTLHRQPSGEYEARNLRLEAFDLRSGDRVWAIVLRDIRYFGPVPP